MRDSGGCSPIANSATSSPSWRSGDRAMNHAVPHSVALSTRRLAAHRGWSLSQLTEIWDYKELLYFLIWRDIKVRYTQTVLGAGWAVLQPVLTMVIFTIFFGRLAGMPSDGIPYPVFSMAALVPWTYFATALAGGSQSVVASQHVIAKVYFP